MSHGQIHAWNILDRKPVLAKWEEGLFTEIYGHTPLAYHALSPPPL